MRAVHFGAGNIGLGFIGDLLNMSGYFTTFIDVDSKTVERLNKNESYEFYLLDRGFEKKTVNHVNALSPLINEIEVIEALGKADVITTSVWADNLGKISRILAKGLKKRIDNGMPPVNVLACENALFASDKLKQEVLNHKDLLCEDELSRIASFPNVVVDRLALTNYREGEKCIDVDSDFQLIIDKNALVDSDAIPIKDAIYTNNLTKYLEKKLYIVNCGHAVAGYLGFVYGYRKIQDALNDATIIEIVRGVLSESADALCYKFGFKKEDLEKYITSTIKRFMLPEANDDIFRICRAPERKLSPTDRLVAPCLSYNELIGGVSFFPVAIAAVFLYDDPSDIQSQEILNYVKTFGISAAITKFTGIDDMNDVHDKIKNDYFKLKSINKNTELE